MCLQMDVYAFFVIAALVLHTGTEQPRLACGISRFMVLWEGV